MVIISKKVSYIKYLLNNVKLCRSWCSLEMETITVIKNNNRETLSSQQMVLKNIA